MKLFLIVALCVFSTHAKKYVSDDLEPLSDGMIDAVNNLFTHYDSLWKAGNNFKESDSIEWDKLLVTNENFDNYTRVTYSADSKSGEFDARKKWPHCKSIGRIYDQTKGYPSWIYPVISSVADRLCIQAGVKIDVQATVDRIMKATGGFNSVNIDKIFNYWSEKGIQTVESPKNSSCSFSSDCESNLGHYYNVTLEFPRTCYDIMADIVTKGPAPFLVKVYSDFPSYKSGTYSMNSKKFLGMHVVKIIGWGRALTWDFWVVANAWGTNWGDGGFAKIQACTDKSGEVPYYPSASFTLADNAAIKSLSQEQLFDLA